MQEPRVVLDWRGIRRALGLTQEEMAEMLCLDARQVRNLEQHRSRANRATYVLLRAWLSNAECIARLRDNGYAHPYPEDAIPDEAVSPRTVRGYSSCSSDRTTYP